MITLKSQREIDAMDESGTLLANAHIALREIIKPGITSWEINEFMHNYIEKHGGIAEQIGFEGYEYATCVSVNDEICHGFPSKKEVLKKTTSTQCKIYKSSYFFKAFSMSSAAFSIICKYSCNCSG